MSPAAGRVYPRAVRIALLAPALLPFLYFAVRDHRLHMTARKVPKLEHVLHGLLALAIFAIAGTAFTAQMDKMLIALGVFFVLGLADELVYHRDIPIEEHSVHAKEHLLLFMFVVLAFAVDRFGASWGIA